MTSGWSQETADVSGGMLSIRSREVCLQGKSPRGASHPPKDTQAESAAASIFNQKEI